MAGTANDYMGTLSKTRSGRDCDKWPIRPKLPAMAQNASRANTTKTTRVRSAKIGANVAVAKTSLTVGREYFNDSVFPEGSAKNASNYCRNPSRNIAGTWCYTKDPLVPHDLCNVRDCEKPGKYCDIILANILFANFIFPYFVQDLPYEIVSSVNFH